MKIIEVIAISKKKDYSELKKQYANITRMTMIGWRIDGR